MLAYRCCSYSQHLQAFPIKFVHTAGSVDLVLTNTYSMALLICLFNDGNSIFQIILCGTMWGLNRFERPPWTTGCLIPLSFLCGIASAVFIWRGGERTKRVEEVRERLRAALGKDNPFVASEKELSVVAPSSRSANVESPTPDMPRASSPGDTSTLHVDTQKGGTAGSQDGHIVAGKASPTNTEGDSPIGTWDPSPTNTGGESPTSFQGDSAKVR